MSAVTVDVHHRKSGLEVSQRPVQALLLSLLRDNPQIPMVSVFEQCSAEYLHDPFEVGCMLIGAFHLLLCMDPHCPVCQDTLISAIRSHLLLYAK